MKRQTINIFIFRRDLRLIDNLALNKLHLKEPNTKILYLFIFNPNQIDPKINKYYSKNCVEFMIKSLHDLNNNLDDSLHYFHGKDIEILNRLLNIFTINSIAFNEDYTPFAINRDLKLKLWCESKKIDCISSQDYTIFPQQYILTDQNKPYEVFTPFYKKCLINIVNIPECLTNKNIIPPYKNKHLTGLIKNIDKYYNNDTNHLLLLQGGRENALNIIKNRINKGEFTNYEKYRNFPSMNKTTRLSPYIKFGCISIREVYHSIKKRYGVKHGLIRELFWREFYSNITFNFPKILNGQLDHIYVTNQAFKDKYNKILWKYDENKWIALTTARTGYPLVDAGIKQLLTTGWCHNRCRMVIASFVSKDLHVHPNDFEKWFATKLIDYDPSSNSGGVQWSYSIGVDSQPYFRIFNPLLQSLNFDKDCKYIKQWLPELKNVKNEDIHEWPDKYHLYSVNYPPPIVNHSIQSKKIKEIFKKII
jgi:deoxyribodipyrimidine photo-lyase